MRFMNRDFGYSQRPWLRHYRVSPDIEVPTKTVLDAYWAYIRRFPRTPALRYFDYSIDYAEFNHQVNCFTAMLAVRGVGPGDRVALSLQNDPEFAIALLGAWMRGAIVVPLNPMFRQKGLEYHLRDAGARTWIVLNELATEEARAAAAAAGVEHVITTEELADLLKEHYPTYVM